MSGEIADPSACPEQRLAGLLVPQLDPRLLRTEPFRSEADYWTLAGDWMRARFALLKPRMAIQGYLLSESRPVEDEILEEALAVAGIAGRRGDGRLPQFLEELPFLLHVRAMARRRSQEARVAQRARRACTPPAYPAPRILRLAARLGLRETELEVLELLVLLATRSDFDSSSAPDAGDVAEILDLGAPEYLDLFDESRPLRKLGLVQIERDILGWARSRDLKIDLPLVKALRGLALIDQDHFALSEATIRAVLEEEPGMAIPVPLTAEERPENSDEFGEEDDDDPSLRAAGLETAMEEDTFDEEAPATDTAAEPFADDVEYLSAHIDWFRSRIQWKKMAVEAEEEGEFSTSRNGNPASLIREAAARERVAAARLRARIDATSRAASFVPRGEQLARKRGLEPFEKHVLLILASVGLKPSFAKLLGGYRASCEVGDLLAVFCDSDAEQVAARKYFYRDARLLTEGLVTISGSDFDGDVLRRNVEIDRRITEYLLGLETERTLLVEGGHLFTRRVDLERVILPAVQKQLIVDTVVGFPAFRKVCRESGLETLLGQGDGQVILFHGESGTGKTLMAHAIATLLGKRILLVNFPTIGEMTGDQALRFLFREAKVHDAILFFDECDGIFENRDRNSGISLILTEIERHDGLIIMATNRAQKLDEAMHRRITMAVEFRMPDAAQREAIWRAHVPEGLPLEGEPDFAGLARRYELSGGFIKNAVLTALSLAAARDRERPVIRPEDLERGARLQLQNRLRLATLTDRVVPQEGFSALVVSPAVREALLDLVSLERARRTLVSEWGFEREAERGLGTSALFFGPSGTGKSLAAEAIAWELGRPIKRVNAAQLVSKWVGEGAKNIESVFEEARQHEAVLVFDEADALFAARTTVGSSTDRYANLDVAVLLSAMERFSGVVILTTNLAENVDAAFRRRLRFVVEFAVPDAASRHALWRRLLPDRLPVEDGLDLQGLADEFVLTGAQVRNAIVKAASRAALRLEPERRVTRADLHAAAAEELRSNGSHKTVGFSNRFPNGGEPPSGELGSSEGR